MRLVSSDLPVKVSDNQWCEHQEGDHLERPLSKFSSGCCTVSNRAEMCVYSGRGGHHACKLIG